MDALLERTPHARARRRPGAVEADNFGVVVLQVGWTERAGRLSIEVWLDRCERAVVLEAAHAVFESLTVGDDLPMTPLKRLKDALRRVKATIPPGRWGA